MPFFVSLVFSLVVNSAVSRHDISDEEIHPLRAGYGHGFLYMAVLLQCEGRAVMAKVLLHSLDVVTVFQRVRCEAVAKIMKALLSVVDLPDQSFIIVMRLIDLRYPYCSDMYGFALAWIIFAKSCAIRSPA